MPGAHGGKEAAASKAGPVFVELPEMVANLNTGRNRASFVKLKARLELAKAEDTEALKAAQPRILDLFQTYLREMRPEELRGSAGTYRLREELIARANIAAAPAQCHRCAVHRHADPMSGDTEIAGWGVGEGSRR